ncbi:MAG: hypothetical protein H7237_02310 [Alkalinema sp. FL-bin-369]|nr:hypothetical protein [Leptolyngbyaceae cyanobacterium LF-bin-369]
MSLHLFSIALISISSNADSFAVAIAYGIKKVRITICANLLIAVVSSLGTFLSISIGQMIGGYLSQSTANILGSGVLISIGIFGMWQTIRQEHKRHRIEKYAQQQHLSMPNYFYQTRSADLQADRSDTNYIDRPTTDIKSIVGYMKVRDSIPLAFSLTINNIGGGIGAGISGLDATLTTGSTFVLAVLALLGGSALGEKFSKRMTDFWAGFSSSGLIILIGIYEYFN